MSLTVAMVISLAFIVAHWLLTRVGFIRTWKTISHSCAALLLTAFYCVCESVNTERKACAGCPSELCPFLCFFLFSFFLFIQALKESFIKAIGTGLGFNLQRAEFHLSPEAPTLDQVVRQTRMYLDEEEEPDWMFEVSPPDGRLTAGWC